MKAKASQKNRFLRLITTPFRALGKARDFYVKSMMDCANSNIIGLQGTSQAPSLPRSFSASSARSDNSEDFRELVRAASAHSFGNRVDLEEYIKQEMVKMRAGSGGGPRAMPPRSISVAMGKIDEDSPCCYFGEDIDGNGVINVKNEMKYPRSKSHAVARTDF
ncbi:hypothetical protein Salat_0596400 [Sesamum alatum]|uniref:Uncharacterized protein n=1 Tax=Sesamum alatum TaxID=300844 RepID=A0AAE1YQ67_9LAMI|nr:hypothetical protein Salat_0596400 [Sesamum alatum]